MRRWPPLTARWRRTAWTTIKSTCAALTAPCAKIGTAQRLDRSHRHHRARRRPGRRHRRLGQLPLARHPSGEQCIVGEKTYIAYDVVIGREVKINAFVYIWASGDDRGWRNDRRRHDLHQRPLPPGDDPDLLHLRPSEPDEHTLPTLVREGATVGAGCTIGNDLVIGRFAMIGIGACDPLRPRLPSRAWRPARRSAASAAVGELFVASRRKYVLGGHLSCAVCGLRLRRSRRSESRKCRQRESAVQRDQGSAYSCMISSCGE